MRVLAQLSRRERTAIVVCLGLMVATLGLSLVDHIHVYRYARSMMDPENQRLRYTGTIVVPHVLGQCRYTQFDNKTSELRGSEVSECLGGSLANPAGNRLDSLRDAFKR